MTDAEPLQLSRRNWFGQGWSSYFPITTYTKHTEHISRPFFVLHLHIGSGAFFGCVHGLLQLSLRWMRQHPVAGVFLVGNGWDHYIVCFAMQLEIGMMVYAGFLVRQMAWEID